MQKLIRRSTGSWKLWEGQEKAVPAGRKIESKRRAQVWRKKISYLGGSRHSLGCLLYRPCPQPGPWRRLQKKPRPIDAEAPPRTCGPAPSGVLSKARSFPTPRLVPPPKEQRSALQCQDFSSGPAPARRPPPLLRSAPMTHRNPQEGGA